MLFIKTESFTGQTLLIPIIESFHTVFDLYLMMPTQAMEFAHVNEFAHDAVRFGGIENDLPLKTHRLRHQLAQFTNRQFLACTHIDMAVADLTQ